PKPCRGGCVGMSQETAVAGDGNPGPRRIWSIGAAGPPAEQEGEDDMTGKMTGKTLSALALAGIAAASLATAALAEKMPKGGPGDGPMMLQRFDEMDADKDGKVTEAEIRAWHDARFAAADADGNGSL